MDITDIELEPLGSTGNPGSSQRPARATGLTGWAAIGLAVVATAVLGVLVVRNDAGSRGTDDPTALQQDAAVLPAASPAQLAVVTTSAGPGGAAYDACSALEAGSADSMERFVERCRLSLRRAAYYIDEFQLCVPSGGGSADSMERWVEYCRRDVERTLSEGAQTLRCIPKNQICVRTSVCRPMPDGSPDSMERRAERCALGLGVRTP